MTLVLVTGASGLVGAAVCRRLLASGWEVVGGFGHHPERVPEGCDRVAIDLSEERSLGEAFASVWPRFVVHCAAVSDLRSCEVDPEGARRKNVAAVDKLARLCRTIGGRLLFFSSDQVFDGGRGGLREEDEPNPIHVYGRTKADAEIRVRRLLPTTGTVLRLALTVGRSPSGERSASETLQAALARGERPRLFVDEWRSPIHVEDVARAVDAVLERTDLPMLHVGGPERLSRYDLGLRVARAEGLDAEAIEPARLDEVQPMPARPPDLSFDTARLRGLLEPPPRRVGEALAADAGEEHR